MTESLRVQLVQAVRDDDTPALTRLYDQIDIFAKNRPAQHARLPEPLRRHAAARSAPAALKAEWEDLAATRREKGEDPGPALWPLWSHAAPPAAPSASKQQTEKNAAALRALARKYAKRKKQVDHFEKWYAEFETANREVVEQLNRVYRRLRRARGHATPPDAPWLPLDDLAIALLEVTGGTEEQGDDGGNTKS